MLQLAALVHRCIRFSPKRIRCARTCTNKMANAGCTHDTLAVRVNGFREACYLQCRLSVAIFEERGKDAAGILSELQLTDHKIHRSFP